LQSIIDQTYQDFEILIIDDGSSDNTKQLISALEYPKVRYIYQENHGLPNAWNTGISLAKGKFIAFLDSDDVWIDVKLEEQVKFLIQNEEKYRCCVTGYIIRNVFGRESIVLLDEHSATLRQIIMKNPLHFGTTWMSHKEVFDEIGPFDENLMRGQDTDWLIRCRQKLLIGTINKPLAIFSQHLNRSAETMEKSRLYFLEKNKSIIKAEGNYFYNKKVAAIFSDLANEFLREKNYRKAGAYALKSFFLLPYQNLPRVSIILISALLHFPLKEKINVLRSQ